MATKTRTIEVELSTTGLDAAGRPQRVPVVTQNGGTAVALEAPPALEVEPTLAPPHPLATSPMAAATTATRSGPRPRPVLRAICIWCLPGDEPPCGDRMGDGAGTAPGGPGERSDGPPEDHR